MNRKRKYCDALGVGVSASDTEIRAAYRKLARKYHPDKNRASGATQKFHGIQLAYEVLTGKTKDPETAQEQTGSTGFRASSNTYAPRSKTAPQTTFAFFGGIDPEILAHVNKRFGTREDMMRFARECVDPFGAGPKRQSFARPPPDIRHDLRCTLEELAQGTKRRLRINAEVFSKTGAKYKDAVTIDVVVRPGTRVGHKYTYPNVGSQTARGGQRGKLCVTVCASKHPLFNRVGDNLVYPIRVGRSSRMDYTLDFTEVCGSRVRREIRGPVTPGTEHVLFGMGMPTGRPGKMRGDLIVKFIK